MVISRIFGTVRGWFSRTRAVFVSGGSDAGETVTFDRVMTLGPAFSCIRVLAESGSCLPFMMYTIEPGGISQAAPEHPLSDLLGDQPNADQSAQQYWEMVWIELIMLGNHFSLIHRVGGQIKALEPLPPYPATVCARTPAGAREFIVSSGPRAGRYPESDVFFLKGYGGDIDCGIGLVAAGRNTFGRMLAIEKHQSKLLAKGVRPNMVMTTPGVLTPEHRAMVQENILKPFAGSENAGGVMLLEGGFEVKPVTTSSADAQLVDQEKGGLVAICGLFGIPPWMIGISEGSSNWGTGLEQQFRTFANVRLKPMTARIISEIRRQLMSRAERKKFEPAFDLEGLYEGDTLTMRRADEIDVRSGIRPVNEIRARRGLPPIEGGNVARMQAQMVPLVIDPSQGGGNDPQQ